VRQRAVGGVVSGPVTSDFRASAAKGIPAVSGDSEVTGLTVSLLTEPEVANRLRVSLACVRRWRLERRGPRFLKVGSLVRYPADELNRWIESLPAGGTPPASDQRQTSGMASV
jgi:excisionase family DNA binding protein